MSSYPDIAALRRHPPRIITLGANRGAVQSILDFDFLCGRPEPSVVAIIATGRRTERYFFGPQEVAIPVYPEVTDLPPAIANTVGLVLNVLSGRRLLEAFTPAFAGLPNLQGGVVFAEHFPERFALELQAAARERNVWLLGTSSIGLIIPGALKLGPIGGTQPVQLTASQLHAPGHVAIISLSGGITNEIIHLVTHNGHLVSWAASVGGERFPLTPPADLFLAAQADPTTEAILYFGELGGTDEYVIADLIKSGRITKPVVAYIAGRADELFPEPPQFGHAGALAKTTDESAEAKSRALSNAGAKVPATFKEYTAAMKQLPGKQPEPETPKAARELEAARPKRWFASSVSRDRPDGSVEVAGQDLLDLVSNHSFSATVLTLWLGKSKISPELEHAFDFILKLLADHGPYQAAVINTIVTARAGQPLGAALSAGLLTVGPRFGGAINQAAAIWLTGVTDHQDPAQLVETLAARREYIAGIGHRKYSRNNPDPRVAAIFAHTAKLISQPFTDFAQSIADITTRKRANLILNVDGAVAATLLDLLHSKEGYSFTELQQLVDIEFFNAVFFLSRSVGLIAHYLDQSRLDEGLFRLDVSDVAFLDHRLNSE